MCKIDVAKDVQKGPFLSKSAHPCAKGTVPEQKCTSMCKKDRSKKVSFIIPCYKSERNIEELIAAIVETVSTKGDEYEIVCVNDASPDKLESVLLRLASANKCIKVINLAQNIGQHRGIALGMRYVKGDVVVNLDDDGQTDPRQCYKLIDLLDGSADMVFARYLVKRESLIRRVGSAVHVFLFKLMHRTKTRFVLNSYMACTGKVAEEIAEYDAFYKAVCSQNFIRSKIVKNATVEHFDRKYGQSTYSLSRLAKMLLGEIRVSFGLDKEVVSPPIIKSTINIDRK